MKLYATTTSERATKGQGGNSRLDIEIKAEIQGRREIVATIQIMPPIGNKAGIFVEYLSSLVNFRADEKLHGFTK
jgi:hypothetical protein